MSKVSLCSYVHRLLSKKTTVVNRDTGFCYRLFVLTEKPREARNLFFCSYVKKKYVVRCPFWTTLVQQRRYKISFFEFSFEGSCEAKISHFGQLLCQQSKKNALPRTFF
jgi:hypothetical protein